MSKHNTPENLDLLRQAVTAKVMYWDAIRELEVAITGDGCEFTSDDEVGQYISDLAAGLITATDTSHLTEEHLTAILEIEGLT